MSKNSKQTVFVNALIHNASQQVLVVRRSVNDHFLPGYLELPGGRVDSGESLEHGLQRKLSQEVNIGGKLPMYFTSLAKSNSHGPYVRVVFEVAYDQNTPIQLSGAHNEYIWVDYNKIPNEKITTDARAILQQYLGDRRNYSNEEKNTTLSIFTDGGSRGNPGPSASAYIIYNKYDEILESGGSYIGITSNNMAEYTGVLLGLQAAKQFAGKSDTILFNIDSMLVVNQMNGLYKIKNRELWPLNQQIRELMKEFQQVRFNHVPRENNGAADGKVNEILDAHSRYA
jgi:ribonuclease HI/ADP-ribose pyrophosphatase YjhB (NUDIX family)